MRTALRRCACVALFCFAGSSATKATAGESFERDVRPILRAFCLDCHGGTDKPKGGLDLRLKRFAEHGGKSGPAIVAGKPEESLMLDRLRAGEMPPGEKKVPPEKIAVIERWIASGAAVIRPEPERIPPGIEITTEERSHWAYQPVRAHVPPSRGTGDRVRTPVDAFVLARLRERGLKFAPDADRRTIVRRASFDLTGLPPTQPEIDSFLADTREDAYERLIDRLLDSPHYGERWARHWLDVAGYADSEGNGSDDTLRPYSYKFRDYVVRSLNADKPLDRFIVEQLAGDELVARPWGNLKKDQIELLSATGFLRMAVDGTATGGVDEALASNQVVADTLKIVGSTFLGLTVGCAQCHDHRYDPIPQTDYYRLRAVFEPALDPQHWRRPVQRLVSLYTDADRAKASAIESEVQGHQKKVDEKTRKFVAAAVEKELLKFPEPTRGKLRAARETAAEKRTDEQKKLLASNPSLNLDAGVLYQYNQAAADELKKDQEAVNARRAQKPIEDFVSVLDELPGSRPETHLFHRGDHRQPKQAVRPGDLTIAAEVGTPFEIPDADPKAASSGRRLAYARQLVNGRHPLVGRVLANRAWLHHFGRGLVETPGDFGALGARPTHPELLDWLARELVSKGWSLKSLHRLIMTSTVYRQSSRRDPEGDGIDSENVLLGHYPVRRLDAETMRDGILALSGRLDRTLYGSPVPVAEDTVGLVLPANDSPRRSLYLQVRRTRPVSLLATFDAPVMTLNCDRRVPSTTAPQSLMLMNSEFMLDHAAAIAKRLRAETPADDDSALTAPWTVALASKGDAWRFGYGEFDAASQRVKSFTPLPHFNGSAWQGGPSVPAARSGWALLHASGGHAGESAGLAVIRRWVSPGDGTLVIAGKFKHAGRCGDGVRGRIVSGALGLAGSWSVKQSEAATDVAPRAVHRGETIDFVVDCVGDVNCDSFEWPVRLSLEAGPGRVAGRWDSAADFSGSIGTSLAQQIAHAWRLVYQRPISVAELRWACEFAAEQRDLLDREGASGDRELTVLTNLCQQLLNSNEFLYVD